MEGGVIRSSYAADFKYQLCMFISKTIPVTGVTGTCVLSMRVEIQHHLKQVNRVLDKNYPPDLSLTSLVNPEFRLVMIHSILQDEPTEKPTTKKRGLEMRTRCFVLFF